MSKCAGKRRRSVASLADHEEEFVADVVHSPECWMFCALLDERIAELRAEYQGALQEDPDCRVRESDWRNFRATDFRAERDEVHDALYMTVSEGAEDESRRVKCRGITPLLQKLFWPRHSATFAGIEARRSSVRSPAPIVCGNTGPVHGTTVHSQVNRVVRQVAGGGTVCEWLKVHRCDVLDTCTLAVLRSIVLEQQLLPVAAELDVVDDVAFCHTRIDVVGMKSSGERVLFELKTGYGGGAFSEKVEGDRQLHRSMQDEPDTPFNRAALQLCLTQIILQQRYQYAVEGRILHVRSRDGTVDVYSMPEWVHNAERRAALYRDVLGGMSDAAFLMYRRKIPAQ